jgi:hypothetical protein
MTLSESGALLWKKLEGGAEVDELVEAIVGEYEIDETTANADVNEFVCEIDKKGLFKQ